MSGPTTSFETDALSCAADATFTYRGVFLDDQLNPIPLSALVSLTLSLFDTNAASPAVVNDVDGIGILNTDRGVVSAGGQLTLTLAGNPGTVGDTSLTDPTNAREWRSILLRWTYNSPTGLATGRHRVRFLIVAFEEN